MRYFIFAVVVVIGVFFASGISTLKNSAFNQASALGSISSFSVNPSESKNSNLEEVHLEYFDQAFDLEEGRSMHFEDLSITFIRVTKPGSCNESNCRTIELELSAGNSSEKVEFAAGEYIDWEGYKIKTSQIAPLENLHNVPHRAVLLIHKES